MSEDQKARIYLILAYSDVETMLNALRVPGINAVPHEDNLRYFDVSIDGPASSPYEGICLPLSALLSSN